VVTCEVNGATKVFESKGKLIMNNQIAHSGLI